MVGRLLSRVRRSFVPLSEEAKQLKELAHYARYTPGKFNMDSFTLKFPDAASFVSIYREMFHNETYKFEALNERPFIIDCGANIGLSVAYFKKLYPKSEILAFEPDPAVFDYLSQNVSALRFNDITLKASGVWMEETELEFNSEGADGGKVIKDTSEIASVNRKKVKVERLSKYINKAVDFLKIDIEGAEIEVIQEIEPKLCFVKNIFMEYHSFTNRPQDLDTILKILTRNNFRYYLYSPWQMRQHPFVDKIEYNSIDGFLNICASKQN